jgi:hypothetical protein
MKKIKLAVIALFGILTVTAQQGCSKIMDGAIIVPENWEGWRNKNSFKESDNQEVGTIQTSDAMLFKSPIYSTGDEPFRSELQSGIPPHNSPLYVECHIKLVKEFYNYQTRTIVTTISIIPVPVKVIRGPQNWWKAYNSQSGVWLYGGLIYSIPKSMTITSEKLVTGQYIYTGYF